MEKTLVIFVLDESGSMQTIKPQVISGFNEYIDTLKPYGKQARFTFVKFDSNKVTRVCSHMPVKDVTYLNNETFAPGALTPLYDAVGETIKEVESTIAGKSDKSAVLFVIMTDGQENCSKSYSRKQLFEIISKKESEEQWNFIYLGANQDSWAEGSKMGMSGLNTRNYEHNEEGAIEALACASIATEDYFNRGSTYSMESFAGVNDAKLGMRVASIRNRVKEDRKKWQVR